jgi:orotate phosphoribosyltransferase
LLIDDTWTTGSSAQSAAMALRRAGALTVVTVVLGRHVGLADAAGFRPAVMPFHPASCAVHDDARVRR